jgi:histidinol-phosphate aminotransferase
VRKALEILAGNTDVLRKYPSPTCDQLEESLGKYYGIPRENLFVGVGSDDVLSMAFLTFFHGNKPVLFPDITYSFYDVWADVYRIPYKQIPLDENFEIHEEDYEIENGGIVIANPNAPTGVAKDRDWIDAFLSKHKDVVVIVDEAYVDFGGETALPLIEKYDNLLITRTFSKSMSLAGSRIGAALGSKELIKYLWDVRNSFNSYTMDSITQEIGVAALSDRDYFDETRKKIIETRERFSKELSALGFVLPESSSNFVFAKHPAIDAAVLFEDLKKEGIYVRHFKGERVKDHLRITIGLDREMERLLDFLKAYVSLNRR